MEPSLISRSTLFISSALCVRANWPLVGGMIIVHLDHPDISLCLGWGLTTSCFNFVFSPSILHNSFRAASSCLSFFANLASRVIFSNTDRGWAWSIMSSSSCTSSPSVSSWGWSIIGSDSVPVGLRYVCSRVVELLEALAFIVKDSRWMFTD